MLFGTVCGQGKSLHSRIFNGLVSLKDALKVFDDLHGMAQPHKFCFCND